MHTIKLSTATAIVALALVGTAFAPDPMVGGAAMYPSKNIIQNAVNSKDHTTLVAAVRAGGFGRHPRGQRALRRIWAHRRSFRSASRWNRRYLTDTRE